MTKEPMPNLCMGLARFIGSILFLAVSYFVFSYLNDAWELGVNHLIDISNVGAAAYGTLAIAIVAGMIGGFLGQGIGGAIPIRSNELAINLNIIWHYLANTSIVWIMLSITAASINLGDYAEIFFYGPGETFYYTSVILAIPASLMLVVVMRKSGRRINMGDESGYILAKIGPIVIGVVMGIFQFGAYGLSPVVGGIAGFILPYIVIPITAKMWTRDTLMRGPHAL